MANRLLVRRVKFQDLNTNGTPDGPATFGVIASDDFETRMTNRFPSLAALNQEIEKKGCIMDLIDATAGDEAFVAVDRSKIGTANYYGSDCY